MTIKARHVVYWMRKSRKERARFRAYLMRAFQQEPCCIHNALLNLIQAAKYVEGKDDTH